MARAGLGSNWKCLFANDFDQKKCEAYCANWGDGEMVTRDVGKIVLSEIKGSADLVWASFPCQDLSLAGSGAGLKGVRSGTFWPFWKLVKGLVGETRAPRVIVLENVYGTLTSHGGKDFSAICAALQGSGYRYGAMIMDAVDFVPQSRPRLFVVAVQGDIEIPEVQRADGPSDEWHGRALKSAYGKLSEKLQSNWVWWSMPTPALRNSRLADMIEESPDSVPWHSKEETQRLLDMMSDVNLAKVRAATKTRERTIGTIYKRTRIDGHGSKVQRAEVRFDDVAGCLRTPMGGSSRQLILVVEGGSIRSRLISSRETARLMGLPDDYILPEKYNEAYHLTGDGVVVPVVRHIAQHIIEPILESMPQTTRRAA